MNSHMPNFNTVCHLTFNIVCSVDLGAGSKWTINHTRHWDFTGRTTGRLDGFETGKVGRNLTCDGEGSPCPNRGDKLGRVMGGMI